MSKNRWSLNELREVKAGGLKAQRLGSQQYICAGGEREQQVETARTWEGGIGEAYVLVSRREDGPHMRGLEER
jgi:hypothetical protein